MVKFEGHILQLTEIKKFEEQTRLQSLTPLWFRVRRHRITASQMGEICKRRKGHGALATRLKTTRRCMTAAMRRGNICEPIAGKAYATKLQSKVNLYPCQWCCCKLVVTMDCNKSRQKGVQPREKFSIRSFRNQMSNCTKHK